MTDSIHSFHIPVMGTAFTIDSPLKVAKYGISSVISSVDDALIERMRKHYTKVMGEEYIPILKREIDARARRITAYLNLADRIIKDQFEKLKASAFETGSEITRYFEILADDSPLKLLYNAMLNMKDPFEEAKAQEELRERTQPGSIDLNIMTKLDRRDCDEEGNPLPGEDSDAHAALRGYARSKLSSSVVFSAGFNGRLYGYLERFRDFHADEWGNIKKKIVIKVNDYRSAFVQGKYFAKKGLWVSEYRIESGFNCGGHAFGHGTALMGPCLEEFKQKRGELVASLFEIYNEARAQKKEKTFREPHPVRITAQGGIGTANENQFLLDYYKIDGTGWGTPFLLVPEATTTDPETIEKLCKAGKNDLCLSDVSPLNIPFNNLRTSTSELSKLDRVETGYPGSPCSKGYLVSNTEFTSYPICLASLQYQKLKLAQIRAKDLDPEVCLEECKKVTSKSCLCNDLGGAAILTHQLQEPSDLPSPPAVCPGPNLMYFSRVFGLKEMVDHIYGRANILNRLPRPHMFVSELQINIEYFEKGILEADSMLSDQKIKSFHDCGTTLADGIAYYEELIPKMTVESKGIRDQMHKDLISCQKKLKAVVSAHPEIFGEPMEFNESSNLPDLLVSSARA